MHISSTRTIAGLEPGDHPCFLYETGRQHQAMITPFLRQGLERGEKVLYVVDERPPEAILGYLQNTGVEMDPYLASGQLVILTCNDTCLRGDVFDPEGMITLLQAKTEQALAEGYAALRGTVEMGWALHGLPGSERLMEYEARLNDLLPGSKCLVMCQYDRRRFDPEALWNALRTHSTFINGTVLYNDLVSEDTLKNTTRCSEGFACLSGEGNRCGKVEHAPTDDILFVKCTKPGCSYRVSFGYSSVCTCPTRVEIYNRYGL